MCVDNFHKCHHLVTNSIPLLTTNVLYIIAIQGIQRRDVSFQIANKPVLDELETRRGSKFPSTRQWIQSPVMQSYHQLSLFDFVGRPLESLLAG